MRIIAGEARGRRIEAPEGRNTRPTLDRVRENLFNMLQEEVPGSRVLDLFSGSGALSLEALSRGAVEAVLADRDRNAVRVQHKNIEALGYEDCTTVLCTDWKTAVRELRGQGRHFDLVFLDPPYSMTDLQDVFRSLGPILSDQALIVLEHKAGEHPITGDGFSCVRERNWGYCGVSFFRTNSEKTYN